jgi:hypothetical protein
LTGLRIEPRIVEAQPTHGVVQSGDRVVHRIDGVAVNDEQSLRNQSKRQGCDRDERFLSQRHVIRARDDISTVILLRFSAPQSA